MLFLHAMDRPWPVGYLCLIDSARGLHDHSALDIGSLYPIALCIYALILVPNCLVYLCHDIEDQVESYYQSPDQQFDRPMLSTSIL